MISPSRNPNAKPTHTSTYQDVGTDKAHMIDILDAGIIGTYRHMSACLQVPTYTSTYQEVGTDTAQMIGTYRHINVV